jgi:hypothetical protein
MNYSAQLYRIMEDEMGEVGRFVLEKQCKNLNIDPNRIEPHNLPRLSRILSGIMSRFGDEKARRITMAIGNLRSMHRGENDIECPNCHKYTPSDAVVCGHCGTKLSEDETSPRLFADGTQDAEKVQSDIEVVDISSGGLKRK